MSKLGLASRTDAERLILEGRVTVAGRTVRDPTWLVVPERARIAIDGAPAARKTVRLVALHKPRGVVTTRRDPEGRRTVFDLLGPAGHGLQAIGRLDLASTGLLLLTNDTRLAHELTDPARAVPRTYVVTARGCVGPEGLARLKAGVDSPVGRGRPGHERLAASAVTIRKSSSRETHLIIELVEGRNRELRRMFEAIGHEVTRIHRIAFGPYELGTLQPGHWRDLESERISSIP